MLFTQLNPYQNMKNSSISRLLIFLVIANVATWAGHEAIKYRTHDIIFFFHPYVPKSDEELIELARALHNEWRQGLYGGLAQYEPSSAYEPSRAAIESAAKHAHLESWGENHRKYWQTYTARIDMIFGGMKAIFFILLIGTLIFWLKTSPFSRLAGFVGLTSFSNKAKLSMLEKELNGLRRQHALGLVSDDAFGRRTAELQEKASKLLI